MKTHLLALVALGTVASALDVQAQFSATFGPIYRQPDSPSSDTVSLDVSNNPTELRVNVVLSISADPTRGSYIRPNSGTPRESSVGVPNVETYTITYADLVVRVKSADGMILPEPVEGVDVHLGQFQFTVSLTMPAGIQGDPYPNIPFPPPSTVPLSISMWLAPPLSLDTGGTSPQTFTVTFLGDPFNLAVVAGAKTPEAWRIVGELNGELAVPEPGQYALLAGLGLMAFAGCRRVNRS